MKRPRNLFLLLLSSLLPATTYADSVTIRAAGIDTKTGEKIFTEMSRARFKDGLILSAESEFRDVAGNVYTRQKVEVKKSSVAPDYTLHDLRDGHREAVRHTGAGYEILFKADAKAAEEKIFLKIPEHEMSAVTLPGFSNFVVTHWDALIAGKAMYFYLILPTQRDYYRFRLIRDSATAGQVRFRIELENFVLRMFVDAIRISFDIGKKRLVGYEGIHFVRDLPKFLGRKMRVTYKAD
jgi:hypothetical protein